VGFGRKKIKPRQGRQKIGVKTFLSPRSGAWTICGWKPTVSPWATIGRCSAAANGF
jgi:hypothetical protein